MNLPVPEICQVISEKRKMREWKEKSSSLRVGQRMYKMRDNYWTISKVVKAIS
jgi:hypothetical protein